MKKLIPLALPVAAALAVASAAQAQTDTATAAPAPAPRASHHARDRIEHEELVTAHGSNAYDIISSLRPNWLNRHRLSLGSAGGEDNLPDMMVIADGAELGDVDALKSMSPQDLWTVEFVSASTLYARYGRRTRTGGIVIHSTPTDDPGAKPTS